MHLCVFAGDDPDPGRLLRPTLAGPWIPRHALHAAALSIRHPRTGEPLTVRAPLPPDFLAAMEQLGLRPPPA